MLFTTHSLYGIVLNSTTGSSYNRLFLNLYLFNYVFQNYYMDKFSLDIYFIDNEDQDLQNVELFEQNENLNFIFVFSVVF